MVFRYLRTPIKAEEVTRNFGQSKIRRFKLPLQHSLKILVEPEISDPHFLQLTIRPCSSRLFLVINLLSTLIIT